VTSGKNVESNSEKLTDVATTVFQTHPSASYQHFEEYCILPILTQELQDAVYNEVLKN